MKKISVFLIFNVIIAVVAFSYSFSLVDANLDTLSETPIGVNGVGLSPQDVIDYTAQYPSNAGYVHSFTPEGALIIKDSSGAIIVDTSKEAAKTSAKSSGIGGFFKNIFGIDSAKTGGAEFGDVIISSVAWGLGAYAAIKIGGSLLGFDEKKVDAAAIYRNYIIATL